VSVAAPERPALIGSQEPRFLSVPPYGSSAGSEAADLAAQAGLVLDPWQRLVLEHALGETPDGRWSAFEVGVLVSRQNGKGSILEARELAGLFLFGERLILHSAHEFKTAQEAFLRIRELIEGTRAFSRRVKRITNNTAEVGIELMTGQRLKFVARSGGSGRGFSGDVVILDEAFNLPDAAIEALMPTMSARPNPQLWYTSSAPDKDLAPCLPLTRVRNRGVKGGDPSLAYFEWSAELCSDDCPVDCTEHDDPADPAVWAATNPGMGIRITQQHIGRELASMGRAGFARERLGVGNYPAEQDAQFEVVPETIWRGLADPESQAGERVAFAVDVTPGGTHASIGVAGVREDGLGHVEVVDHRRGTGWIVGRLAGDPDDPEDVGIVGRHGPVALVIDPGSPAGFLLPELEEALTDPDTGALRVEIVKTSAGDVARATGGFIAACGVAEGDEATLRHRPHPALDAAVAGASTKALGDGVKWDRRSPSTDISPLRAVTLARWGLATAEDDEEAPEPWVMFG
jgi:hypothetical protein